ncbi:MAG: MarR family transcriptional regulator, partial [Thermoleophilaceae bacterium]
ERTGGRPYVPVACALLRGEGPRLDPVEFRLAMALAGFQGDRDDCYPSRAELATAARVKAPTVSAAVNRLVDRGLVARWRPSRRGRNHYDVRPLLRGTAAPSQSRLRPPVTEPSEAPPEVEPQGSRGPSLRSGDAQARPAGEGVGEGDGRVVPLGEVRALIGRIERERREATSAGRDHA